MEWSLNTVLASLHDDIHDQLERCRKTFAHPVTKGNSSEKVWLELFQNYLPKRYEAREAHIVDSHGNFSQQIDVVIYDRQYSPFILNYQGQAIIPAESVYAVFEAKQTINKEMVEYAQKKVVSARNLHRTSLPIPHAGGIFPAKPLNPILGGILAFESDWQPGLGNSLVEVLQDNTEENRLDFGCIAAHGYFDLDAESNDYILHPVDKPATGFLFQLLSKLQSCATVPMIDIQAYAKWLTRDVATK